MLTIKKKGRNDRESDIYINDKLFPGIISYLDSDTFFCQNFPDFNFLCKFSLKELIENKVNYILCNHRNFEENLSCYFSYSVTTKYQDLDYLNYIEESGYSEDEINPEYIEKGNHISASLSFKFGEWKKLYSIKEFQLFVHKLIIANEFLKTNTNIYWADLDPYDHIEALTIEFRLIEEDKKPIAYLEQIIPLLTNILKDGIEEMDNEHSLDVYSTYFNFPEEYKISCKQYLMYFAQFLLDLGISVNTEVKDTSQGTFFSVVPHDKNQAIENIKELLVEYMNAPNTLEVEYSLTNQSDFAVTQFQANILHLRSQLAFANTQIEMKQAIIQAKDTTIQSLNLANYQLSEMIQSQKPKDEESIIDGVVSVTKFEKAGFKINFPEILRKLKRKL